MKSSKRVVLAIATATLLVATSATPASASSDTVYSANRAGSTAYYDAFDQVEVCDRLKDAHGAIGWISVKQADGSWSNFPRVYEGGGVNHCTLVSQDVIREFASIRIYSCWVDGAFGTPYNCGSKVIDGA